MPFNGSGTFSIINTFVPNTTILSAAVNQNFTDIASGLSNCLTRDGQAGMTAVLKLINGSSGSPSLAASADTATGLYFPATGVLGLVANALGIKLNSEVYQAQSGTIGVGGTNYAVGDTITETGGTAAVQAVFTVASVSGGVVTGVTATFPGIYTVKPTNPVAQGSTSGSGSGCTINIAWNDPTSGGYRLALTTLADALLWTSAGASSFVSGLMAKANGYDFAVGIGGGNLVNALSTGVGLLKTAGVLSAPATPPQGSFKNLAVKVASNTTVTVTADAVVVTDGTNFLSVAPNATCNLGTAGVVNALDTGTIATSSWYYMWVIYNGTTTGTLASLSSTAPTMPSGYTYKARIGAVRTASGSAQLLGTWQLGRRAQYIVGLAQTSVLPVIQTGVQGSISTPTWVACSVTTFVPTTASVIYMVLATVNSGLSLVAPNNGYQNLLQSAPVGGSPPIYTNTTAYGAIQVNFLLQSTNVYYASDTTGNRLIADGWDDNI